MYKANGLRGGGRRTEEIAHLNQMIAHSDSSGIIPEESLFFMGKFDSNDVEPSS